MLQSMGLQSQIQCDFSRHWITSWWFFSVFQHFHCAVLLPFNLHYLWWKANLFYTCVSMCYFLYIRSLFFGYFYDSLFILRLQQFDRVCPCAFFCVFILHLIGEGNGPHSSVLAWRIPGMGEPGGLPSPESHRVRHDWSDLVAAVAASCMWLTGFLGFISEYLWSNFRNLRPLFQILFLPCFFPFFSRTLITLILDEIIFINRPLGIWSFHLNCFLLPHLTDV